MTSWQQLFGRRGIHPDMLHRQVQGLHCLLCTCIELHWSLCLCQGNKEEPTCRKVIRAGKETTVILVVLPGRCQGKHGTSEDGRGSCCNGIHSAIMDEIGKRGLSV